MKKLVFFGIAIALVLVCTERGRRARMVCIEEILSGVKPLEAVATAVAAFVGPAPEPPPPPPPPPRPQ